MIISDFNNIAIFQTAFIGDIALTLPLAQIIKNINSNCKLTFITTPQAADLVNVCAAVDEVIIFDKRKMYKGLLGTLRFSELMKSKCFDLWICPHRSFRSSIISRASKNAIKIGFMNSSLSSSFNYKVNYNKSDHEIERNKELLKPFGINSALNLKDVKIEIPSNDIKTSNELSGNLKEYIVIAPGSVWETKKWKESNFANLSNKLINDGKCVVLSGSASDYELCNRISLQSGALNLAGKTNLPQTLEIIKNCQLLITNDSAPTHFAGLMNTPVITIYGPTSPIFGFGPRSENSMIIRNEKLKCSPCRIHGSKKCPLGTHECMTSISTEIVYKTICEIIG